MKKGHRNEGKAADQSRNKASRSLSINLRFFRLPLKINSKKKHTSLTTQSEEKIIIPSQQQDQLQFSSLNTGQKGLTGMEQKQLASDQSTHIPHQEQLVLNKEKKDFMQLLEFMIDNVLLFLIDTRSMWKFDYQKLKNQLQEKRKKVEQILKGHTLKTNPEILEREVQEAIDAFSLERLNCKLVKGRVENITFTVTDVATADLSRKSILIFPHYIIRLLEEYNLEILQKHDISGLQNDVSEEMSLDGINELYSECLKVLNKLARDIIPKTSNISTAEENSSICFQNTTGSRI